MSMMRIHKKRRASESSSSTGSTEIGNNSNSTSFSPPPLPSFDLPSTNSLIEFVPTPTTTTAGGCQDSSSPQQQKREDRRERTTNTNKSSVPRGRHGSIGSVGSSCVNSASYSGSAGGLTTSIGRSSSTSSRQKASTTTRYSSRKPSDKKAFIISDSRQPTGPKNTSLLRLSRLRASLHTQGLTSATNFAKASSSVDREAFTNSVNSAGGGSGLSDNSPNSSCSSLPSLSLTSDPMKDSPGDSLNVLGQSSSRLMTTSATSVKYGGGVVETTATFFLPTPCHITKEWLKTQKATVKFDKQLKAQSLLSKWEKECRLTTTDQLLRSFITLFLEADHYHVVRGSSRLRDLIGGALTRSAEAVERFTQSVRETSTTAGTTENTTSSSPFDDDPSHQHGSSVGSDGSSTTSGGESSLVALRRKYSIGSRGKNALLHDIYQLTGSRLIPISYDSNPLDMPSLAVINVNEDSGSTPLEEADTTGRHRGSAVDDTIYPTHRAVANRRRRGGGVTRACDARPPSTGDRFHVIEINPEVMMPNNSSQHLQRSPEQRLLDAQKALANFGFWAVDSSEAIREKDFNNLSLVASSSPKLQ